VRVARVLIGVD